MRSLEAFIVNIEQISHYPGISIVDLEQVNAAWVLDLVMLPVKMNESYTCSNS